MEETRVSIEAMEEKAAYIHGSRGALAWLYEYTSIRIYEFSGLHLDIL
jgi:hypothetical protein